MTAEPTYICPRCGRESEYPGLCTPCLEARARAEERHAELAHLVRAHGVRYIEQLPPRALAEHRRRWQREDRY